MNNKTNIQKYSYLLALEKVKDEYESNGYEVKADYPITSGIRADLYAMKGDDRVIVDLKASMPTAEMRKRMNSLANAEGMRYVMLLYKCDLSINEI